MYCVNCGKEIDNDFLFCPYCGYNLGEKFNNTNNINNNFENNNQNDNYEIIIIDNRSSKDGIKTAIKVFMIFSCIGCIFAAFYTYFVLYEVVEMYEQMGYNFSFLPLFSIIVLIPLIWIIPMTIHYCKMVNIKQNVCLAFKICTLIFVNFIAGILMLCDTSDN